MDRLLGVLIVLLLVAGSASRATADEPPSRGGGLDSLLSTVAAIDDGKSVSLSGGASKGSRGPSRGDAVTLTAEDRGPTGPQVAVRLNMAQIVAQLCASGASCEGRDSGGFNPLFFAQTEPEEPADGQQNDPGPAETVTINDLARFLPATVELHAEPTDWAVVGVPANFWTYVQPVTVEGELLGQEAAVRFTPRLYEWNYGDGTSTVTQSGGSSWSGVGQEEFTSTSTSHVYEGKQTVQASVTVYWSAEYRFAGDGWTPVEGAVSSASPQQRMLVVGERTVLTAR